MKKKWVSSFSFLLCLLGKVYAQQVGLEQENVPIAEAEGLLEGEEFAKKFIQASRAPSSCPDKLLFLPEEEINQMGQLQSFEIQENSPEKCQSGGYCAPIFTDENSTKLLLFISTSVPEASWKDFSFSLEKLGGSFVMQGMPGGSFQSWALFIKGLRKKGIYAPILIDPEAFKRYHVKTVPALLLEGGTSFDQSIGNVPLLYSLERFAEVGDTKALAKQLLLELHTTSGQRK